MPEPQKGEPLNKFVSRYMGSKRAGKDFPNSKQRAAVAYSEYREAKKFNLQCVYEELAGGFREARLALNNLATRLLHLDTPSIISS